MEQEEVIDSYLTIWVTDLTLLNSSSQIWKANGIPIDGCHGFGHKDIRAFSGQVLLLSLKDSNIQNISISSVHFAREGFRWTIMNANFLPNPPFLISSNLALQIIFNGYVEISEDQDVIDMNDPDGYIYGVVSKYYFGVMTVKENKKIHFIAFSSNKDAIVAQNDLISTLEWDCLIGTIKSLEYVDRFS